MQKINHIEAKAFTCFKEISLQLSPGLNVFIGENGTGKTHLLKLLYAFAKSSEIPGVYLKNFYKKLENIFQIKSLQNLITQNLADFAEVSFQAGNYNTGFVLKKEEKIIKPFGTEIAGDLPHALYIPTHEIITTYTELRDWLERFHHNFEEVYLDLAKAIGHTPTKKIGPLEDTHKLLQEIIQGKSTMENEEFYVEYPNMKVRATLLAEGVKKFVLFDHLIRNQSLTKDTVLFIDEPEVHLNPKYITRFIDMLINLANNGVQIFVGTHDYLFIHQLSLQSEYRQKLQQDGKTVPDIRFHSLYFNNQRFSKAESSDTLADLQHNAILDEYTALYNKERDLFTKSIQ